MEHIDQLPDDAPAHGSTIKGILYDLTARVENTEKLIANIMHKQGADDAKAEGEIRSAPNEMPASDSPASA